MYDTHLYFKTPHSLHLYSYAFALRPYVSSEEVVLRPYIIVTTIIQLNLEP
jgi:hypothetical protein